MAADIEAGIRFTAPYGKSTGGGQMREAIAAMQRYICAKPAQTAGARRLNES
jgi:hypothetical protein